MRTPNRNGRQPAHDAGDDDQPIFEGVGGAPVAHDVGDVVDDDGDLAFSDRGMQCTNGGRIFRQETTCTRRDDGTAHCVARQPERGTRDERIFRR